MKVAYFKWFYQQIHRLRLGISLFVDNSVGKAYLDMMSLKLDYPEKDKYADVTTRKI